MKLKFFFQKLDIEYVNLIKKLKNNYFCDKNYSTTEEIKILSYIIKLNEKKIILGEPK